MIRAYIQNSFVTCCDVLDDPTGLRTRFASDTDFECPARRMCIEDKHLSDVIKMPHAQVRERLQFKHAQMVQERMFRSPLKPSALQQARASTVLSTMAREDIQSLKKVSSKKSLSTMAPDSECEDTLANVEEYYHSGGSKAAKLSLAADPTKDFLHKLVPRCFNFAKKFSYFETLPTTMMIRNIPNRYSQWDIIRELDSLGFEGQIDFFYAPTDMGTMGNVGYAFVNFVDHHWATKCQEIVNGYEFARLQKAELKKSTVTVAHLQGFEANVAHYQKSVVARRAKTRRYGPVIMKPASPAFGTTFA
jgi:hypothetical protein